MKKILIALGLLVIVGIFIGGFVVKRHEEKQRMIEIATSDEARAVYELELRDIDDAAFTDKGKIKSYDVNKDKIKKNPMAGIQITLTINDNPDLEVRLTLYHVEEKLQSSGYVYNLNVSRLLGD